MKLFHHIFLLCILLLALALRIGHLITLLDIMPDATILCGGDALMYDDQAQGFLAGTWPAGNPFRSVPLYPFFLVLVYSIFGVDYFIPLIVQIFLGVLSCALVYQIGKLAFSTLTGLLSALIIAISGPVFLYQICYAQVAITVFLLLLFIYFFLKFYDSNQVFYLGAAGGALGLCTLSRPTMLVIVPIVFIWFLWERKYFSQLVQKSSWFLLAFGLTILPITLHNYQTTGRFIPISEQGSFNFYLGNYKDANGIGPHNSIVYGFGSKIATVLSFPDEGDEVQKKVNAGETTYTHWVLNDMVQHPWEVAELITKKAYFMFFTPDWMLQISGPLYSTSSAVLKTPIYMQLFPVAWPVLVITSLLALIFVRNRYVPFIWLIILAVSITTIIFFVKFRFRLPLMPLLFILTMVLISSGKDWFHHGRRKFVIVLLVLFALFPFLPSIWVIIGLYTGVALYPYKNNLWRFRWHILAGWSYMVIVIFGLQMQAIYKSNSQSQNHFTGPEIWGPVIVGQTFTPNCNGLYKIEVELSRLSYEHDQPYYFHLVTDLNLNNEIYSTRFSVDDVDRWTRKTFTFPPQPASLQQPYFFYIQSPDSHPGNNITVRLYSDLPTVYQRYKRGSVYGGTANNLQPFPADIDFAAYCKETFSSLFNRTIQHIAAAGPEMFNHLLIYYTLIVLHGILFIVSISKIILGFFRDDVTI